MKISKNLVKYFSIIVVMTALLSLMPVAKTYAAFDPSQISGLDLYLHTDDLTSLTNDTSATFGLGNITDGTKVAQWFDRSGNSYNATSTDTTGHPIEPTFHTGGLNGYPYLDFTTASSSGTGGSNTLGGVLTIHNTAFLQSLINSGSYSFTWTYKQNSSPLGVPRFQFLSSNNSAGASRWTYITDSTCSHGITRSGLSCTSLAAVTLNTPHILTYIFQQSSGTTGTESFYIDGTLVRQVTNTLPNDAAAAYYIGGGDYLGTDGLLNSQFYEEEVYTHALSDSQRVSLESYLGNKYGITVNTSVGPLTSGTLSVSNVTKTSQTISASPVTGGTSPYTYSWYRSTTSGVRGTLLSDTGGISGSNTLTLYDAGLSPQTAYYYTFAVTDSASATVYSSQVAFSTHGNNTVNLGFLGDSISEVDRGSGTPPQIFANQLFANNPTLDPHMRNLAISGESLRVLSTVNGGNGYITGYISQFQASSTKYVMIMKGTIDAVNQETDPTHYNNTNFQSDYQDVINHLTAAGMTVILEDIPWRTDTTADTIIQGYNTIIHGLANGTNVLLGSTNDYNYFFTHQSELLDSVHPNQQGTIDLANQWYLATSTQNIGATLTPNVSNVTLSSTGNTINLTAGTFPWTSGTPGTPIFTLSGGTGASITSQTITDSQHATLTLNAGSATGQLIITDPYTNATTSVTVVADTTPPTPGSIAFSGVTSSSITASSTGASDNVALAALPYQYHNVTSNTYSGLLATPWTVTGLSANTSYTFEIGVEDSSGNWATTTQSSTTTLVSVTSPVITTSSASAITQTSATLNGSITSNGNANATQSGFAYGTDSTLSATIATTTLGAQTGTAPFTSSISSLSGNTTYYFRAYATNIAGTGYGTIQSFTTNPLLPTILTPNITSITQTSALASSTIISTGGANVTVRGFGYGIDTTYGSGTTTENGSFGIGAFTSTSLSGLTCNTLYHVRAYATNPSGTVFGSDTTFTTTSCADTTPPTPGTLSFSGISSSGVTAQSTVATDNIALDTNPYQFHNVTTGTYSSLLSSPSWLVIGLSPSTTYTFEVGVKDSSGNWATSTQATVTTLANTNSSGNSSGESGFAPGYGPNITPIIPVGSIPVSHNTFVFEHNLTLNNHGNDVLKLQQFLIKNGFLKAGNDTGYFGPKTKSALSKFQAVSGISPSTGYFGAKTRKSINP